MARDSIRNTAKNIVSLMLVRVFDVLYTFLTMAILAHYFGARLYSDYAYIVALVFIYLPFINFGITPIMVRELSVNPKRREEIFGAGLTFRGILALGALIGTVVMIPFLSMEGRLAVALVVCLLSELCLLGIRICAEVFYTFEKMEVETFLSTTNRLLGIILLLGVVHFSLGFLAVFFTFFAVNLIAFCAALWVLNARFLKPRLVWRIDLLCDWFKKALPIAISFIFLESFLRADILILRIYRNPTEIAYFDVAYKIIYRVPVVASMLVGAISPAMARLAENQKERFPGLVEQVLKLLLILAIPITFVVRVMGPHLMVPFFGEQFKPSELAIETLSWCLFFSFFEPFLTAGLISMNKTWVVPMTNGVILAVNLVLDFLLIPTHGYLGACYANIGAYSSWFFLSLVVFYRVSGGFSPARVAGKVLPVALLMIVLFVGFHSVNPWITQGGSSSFQAACVETGVALLLYGLLLCAVKAVTLLEIDSLSKYLGKPVT
jgi:O-antigen/teichoic acid export membrane protein